MAIFEAEAQLDDLAFAVCKAVEDLVKLLSEHRLGSCLRRSDSAGILDEVAELGVLFLADRRLERDRLLGDLLDLADTFCRHVHLLADLFRCRVATQILQELALDTDELVDGLDHVDRNADRACLVGDSAGDGLTDPPRRVRRELEALRVVELLDSTDEAKVAFLDEVEEEHAAAHIALCDGDDETQVG